MCTSEAFGPKFSVAAAIMSSLEGNIVVVCTQKLKSLDVNIGEAMAALLATNLALSLNVRYLILEGESLIAISAINKPSLISHWHIHPIISDVISNLASCSSWEAVKGPRHVNQRVHFAAKWAATHNSFGLYPCSSPLYSIISYSL
jgi:hypothetical protein